MPKAVVQVKNKIIPVKGGAPAYIAKDQGQKRGLSQDQADNMVPLVYILQAQSPQCMKKNPSYIPGAEAGSIWLRNAPSDPVINGEEGMSFQPCFFSKDWVEWIPRDDGGGFVARHPTDPQHPNECPVKDAKRTEDERNPNRVLYTRPNGNEVIETRYHIGRVLKHGDVPLAYVIPLTSTGHSFSRQWMFDMNNQDVDCFAKSYRLKTRLRQNKQGEWYTWTEEVEDWVSEEDYAAGKKLFNAFAKGIKEIDVPEQMERSATSDEM